MATNALIFIEIHGEDCKTLLSGWYAAPEVAALLQKVRNMFPAAAGTMHPCPFCGNTDMRMTWSAVANLANAVVCCKTCGACGPGADTRDRAVADWNQRSTLAS